MHWCQDETMAVASALAFVPLWWAWVKAQVVRWRGKVER